MDGENNQAVESRNEAVKNEGNDDVAKAAAAAAYAKQLPTVAAACKAPMCHADGLLAGVLKSEATVSIMRSRKGSDDILSDVLSPLESVVALAKITIRRREGVVVTRRMQADLREALAWQVEQANASLLTKFPENMHDAAIGERVVTNLSRLSKKLKVPPTPKIQRTEPPPPLKEDETSGTMSCSSSSPDSSRNEPAVMPPPNRNAAKNAKHDARSIAPRSPGSAFVPAYRATVRIDPRASHIIRSGAVCR
eukprot:jgi/Undpi1/7088/HiC_scaffold_22.g09562.m1